MTWRALYLEALERLSDRQAAQWFVEEASGGTWPSVLDEPVPGRADGAFRSMLARGVALAPGPYEVAFPSMAHGRAELDHTLEVASEAIVDVTG